MNAFLSALSEFIISVAGVIWYFQKADQREAGPTHTSPVLTGFWWSLRYNCGTLAFGSFVLAVV